ncbi:MAG TPA: pitrilysin family protein [Gemmatimonadaceae bacterium]|nr:pitrilysin family protein [Gemmatimonadaceae bacterium]
MTDVARSTASASEVTGRPAPGPPRPYRFPVFTRARLANGLEVIVAPVPRLPLITIRLVIDAGASIEDRAQAGLAHLTALALAEGTLRAGGAQLAEEFEQLGGSLSTSASWDGVHLITSVLSTRFEAALSLLAEVTRTPSFPAREVDRLRDERLAELLELRAEPRGLADERFASILYDQRSRYALPEGGTEDTVGSLTREHCLGFHDRQIRPRATSVVIVGDVEIERAVAAAERTFGDWSGVPQQVGRTMAGPARIGRTLHLIARPGAPQSELRVGHIGIPRVHPDYFSVVVMNAILGGVFSSRINLNLRERNAFTYGASSGFDWRRDAGPFVVSTAVATGVTAAAVREILSEIDGIRAAPPGVDELSLATSYLDGVFPIRFETTEAIASALSSLQIFGLPDDYYDTYRDNVRNVATDDVQRVALAHLAPDRVQIVAVGDPEEAGRQLESLALGPVLYWTPEGVLTRESA